LIVSGRAIAQIWKRKNLKKQNVKKWRCILWRPPHLEWSCFKFSIRNSSYGNFKDIYRTIFCFLRNNRLSG
jgi:hypothetical protein